MSFGFTTVTNESSFSHTSRNGTHFTAARCDFLDGVQFRTPKGLTEAALLQDISEMIGFHATNILRQLKKGFPGYDCVVYTRSK